jgi:L-aminopeptidase/D-esterase-like protein
VVELPAGFVAGSWSDPGRGTGCTVVLAPPGCVAAAEVRGGGPGTRESELLSPAANAPGVDALLLTGGSAFGLGAAEGVVAWLEERGVGYATRAGIVPLVAAAVVYDLPLGDTKARPGPGEARAACEAATGSLESGNTGAGTGCTVGKLLGNAGWCRGGVGTARADADGAAFVALAVVNAFGDVVGEDGAVLAGPFHDGRMRRTVDLLTAGVRPAIPPRENTTLVALLTDARLDKRGAWLVARAGTSGVARAVEPSATPVDGDLVACLASGRVDADPFVLAALAGDVIAHAIRDAVRSASPAPGCPTAAQRAAS